MTPARARPRVAHLLGEICAVNCKKADALLKGKNADSLTLILCKAETHQVTSRVKYRDPCKQ